MSNIVEKLNEFANSAKDASDAAREAANMISIVSDGSDMATSHAVSLGMPTDPLTISLVVFILAVFIGYYVVWNVTPALHTPLMAVTNAISSVIVVGALLALGEPAMATESEGTNLITLFGFIALVLVSINIFGGFLVTQRMLGMYKKNK